MATSSRCRSVADIFESHVESHPDRPLFSFTGGDGNVHEQYSYGSFFLRTNHVARCLLESGLRAGNPALLIYPPGLEMAVAFFACIRAGIVPVPAPPPQRSKRSVGWSRLIHIASDAGAQHALASTAVLERSAEYSATEEALSPNNPFAKLCWIPTDTMVGCSGAAIPSTPSEILLIQYTSGSTKAPRGAMVTHLNAIHNASVCVNHDRPIGVSWLPHFHDMGLLGYFVFSVVRAGEAHCFSPQDFLRKPLLWFKRISETQATITTAPNAAFEYCLREDKLTDGDLEGISLGSLRQMINAAEPVRPETFERFYGRFSRYGLRKSACVAAYGLAEHTLCVTMGGRRRITASEESLQPNRNCRSLVSCGRPVAGADIRIVDPKNLRPVADGELGEIWVDSPSKAAGYWRQRKLSRSKFSARLNGERGSYLRTGDLGFMRDGELYVCGRRRDMLVLNGRNVFPADVEAVLEERFPAVLAGRVVVFGTHVSGAGTEELVLLVEAAPDTIELRDLRRIVLESSGATTGTIARVPRGTIVRTSSGKVARQLCRQAWESRSVQPIELLAITASATSLEDQIEELLAGARALGVDNPTIAQLGLDSIALVNLSLAIEEALEAMGELTPLVIEYAADLSLLQGLHLHQLCAAAIAIKTDPSQAAAILERMLSVDAKKIRDDEQDRMRADAFQSLPFPTLPAGPAPCPPALAGERSVAESFEGCSLITGVTGFLGRYVLRSLIELTPHAIIALVRSNSAGHGVARVRRALIEAEMSPTAAEAAVAKRVRVLPGDLTQSRLGLSSRDWDAASRQVDRVYHCGAEVDYVRSYDLLRAANVNATREVIGLAADHHYKELHYLSTTYIFGWTTRSPLRESDNNPEMERLDFGYAQSKWVAEQLVNRARQHGLPVTIYRPSLVSASGGAHYIRRDVTVRVLGYMIRHGLTVDAQNQVSLLPVDVCARNIVALSLRQKEISPVLHMTCDTHHTIAEVCHLIGERFGYRFAETSLPEFLAHAHAHCTADDELYPLLSFFDRNTPQITRMSQKRYDSTAYRRARDTVPLAVHHPSLEETVDQIVIYLQRERLIPAGQSRKTLVA